MADALIYEALRTPVGAYRGVLAGVRPDDLAAVPVRAVVEGTNVDPAAIDDVILGCAGQAGEDTRNVARMAALLAGLPVNVPGMTINRLCGSGLQSVACAAQAIKAGEGELFVAGGVESMTRAPFVMLKSEGAWNRNVPVIADSTIGWRFTNPRLKPRWTVSPGETAELVREKYGVTRAEQDDFAVASQKKAASALEQQIFSDELVPVEIPQGSGPPLVVNQDEPPRPRVTTAKLARLRAVFRDGGTVTAGNTSGLSDGAAALLIGGKQLGRKLGRKPLARILGCAVAGLDPALLGLGPVPATRKLLKRLGLGVGDFDLVELNEAFAAQVIPCMRELELDPGKVNVYGGAIALGNPLGCTGAKLLVTLVHALRRTGGRYGLVTMCIGVGQGIALAVERI